MCLGGHTGHEGCRRHHPWPTGAVHFAGEAVAAVIARTAYEAADAASAVDVDYQDLPVVLDMNTAVTEGADLVHPDLGTNVSAVWAFDSARRAPVATSTRPSRPPKC